MIFLRSNIAVVYFIFCASLTAQKLSDESQAHLADIIEYIESTSTEAQDYTAVFEDLVYYIRHPLNVNAATADELRSLYLLTDFQIQSLLEYIRVYGPVLSAGELEFIYGFDAAHARRVSPFLDFGRNSSSSFSLKEIYTKSNNQLIVRSSSNTDEGPLTYPDNMRWVGRYRYDCSRNIFAGFTTEKDRSEPFNRPMDFYSGYLQVKDIGLLKSAVLGDFQAGYGQGLVLWSGSNFRQPYSGMGSITGAGITRYTSTDENRYFRGAGATICNGQSEWSLLFSRKKIDASVSARDSINGRVIAVSSLQNSGLHSSLSQTDGKDALGETAVAGNYCYKYAKGEAGFTVLSVSYDAPISSAKEPYKKYSFSGTETGNAGLFFRHALRRSVLFGETAITDRKAGAAIGGITLMPSNAVQVNICYHHYRPGYYSPYQNAFSASSNLSGQEGYSLGMVLKPARKMIITGYTYLYHFLWLQYNSDAPADGRDLFIRTDYLFSKNTTMYIQYRNRNRQENSGIDDMVTDYLVNTFSEKYRYHIDYRVSDQWIFRSRAEYSLYRKYTNTSGFQLSQDMEHEFLRIPATIFFRILSFTIDSYDARIYTYERDVLYSWSVPFYTGRGMRYCLMFRYSIQTQTDLWLKAGITDYTGGVEKPGTEADVSMQMRWIF